MKYGLIGKKLSHSFSKPIHERMADYTYEICELSEDELEDFMKNKDFCGINVTIPYKSAVIPYLDYIDADAQKIGAVNTVVNRNGILYGYNTDFGGLKLLIENSGFDYKGRKVLILGTGGTSKTAYSVAQQLGAAEIVTVGRNEPVNYKNVMLLHGNADYIINTTPVGMYPDCDSAVLDPSLFPELKGVTDVVYNPLNTRLCQLARENNIKATSGLYMLVCQAVLACGLFLSNELNVTEIADSIFRDILREKRNIVLVGMPGSGKTTIGKTLSEITGKEFVDTDMMIAEKHGSIADIFALKGEQYFRDLETEAVRLASRESGRIIATGGGAVLRKQNIDLLRQNGVIIFLNRPLEDIVPTDDRPLSRDREALEKRFSERYEIYCTCSDYEIKNSGTPEAAVKKILEIL